MNILKKANRGLLLTIAVLICVAVYLSVTAVAQAGEKKEIREVCRNYYQAVMRYSVLPESAHDNAAQYADTMKSEIGKYWDTDCFNYRSTVELLSGYLSSQSDGTVAVRELEKKVRDDSYIVFMDGYATVTLDYVCSYDLMWKDTGKDADEFRGSEQLILTKTNGEWKIVYSDFMHPLSQGGDSSEAYYGYEYSYRY